MISFPPGHAAQVAKRNGAAPAWILEIPFAAGTVYLSDRAFTVTNWDDPPIVTLPWIASWGRIVENLSGVLAMPMVSGFSVDIIIDPKAATSIRDLIRAAPVEKLRCVLYQWDEDLDAATDPPVPRWVGNIIDHQQLHELLYRLDLVDQSVVLDKPLGRVLSLADYPNAHLNDVGRQMTIGYGALDRVPALRLDVPKKTTLSQAINEYATAFTLSEDISPNGRILVIGDEEIEVLAVDGKDVTNCKRASNTVNTGPFQEIIMGVGAWGAMCAHPTNGNIYLCRTDLGGAGDIYIQTGGTGAFVPIGTGNIYWSGICADPKTGDVYACRGTSGDIYRQAGGAGAFVGLGETSRAWNGMCAHPTNGDIYACVINGDIYKRTNGSGNFQPLSQVGRAWYGMAATPSGDIYAVCNNGDIYKQTGGAGNFAGIGETSRKWYGLAAAPNGDMFATVFDADGDDVYYRPAAGGAFTGLKLPLKNYYGVTVTPSNAVYVSAYPYGSFTAALYFSPPRSVAHAYGDLVTIKDAPGTFLFLDNPCKSIGRIDAVREEGVLVDIIADCVAYTGQTGDELAGYEGMAVVTTIINYLVGDNILISGEGYKDDGSGMITGAPNSLIERPDHIFAHLLYTYRDWPLADFWTNAASAFAADGYKFSLAILDRKRLKELCAAMAFQCRCWFRFSGGKAQLTYRPDTLTSSMTIRAGMTAMNADYTTTRTVRPSPLDEVINVIQLYYKRDWNLPAGRSAYQAVLRGTDDDSIDAYEEKEQEDLFLFDYVRDDDMAADLLAFYLAQYPFRTDVATQEVSLRCSALEFGDAVTLAELDNLVGQVMEVGITPGSKDTLDMISLTVRGAQP